MFCQECGAKNQDDGVFCQECGVKLETPNVSQVPKKQQTQPQNSQPQQGFHQNQHGYVMSQQEFVQPKAMPATPSKPMSKKTKIMIGVIAALCVFTAFVYNYAKQQYSPEKIAEKHFLNVMNCEWNKVYEEFELVESEFLTRDYFIRTQEDQVIIDYNTYNVGAAKLDESSLGTVVNITYRLKGDSDSLEYYIYLNKQAGKRLLFFDPWKVSASPYIQKDYSIRVPNNTIVTLGGIELGLNYISQTDSYYTYYVIPELFQGEYDLTITQENMQDINTIVSTYDMGYYLDYMTLKEEVSTELINTAQETLNAIYSAGLTNSDFSQIADYFSVDETVRTQASDSFYYFKETIYSGDDVGLKGVDFYDFSGSTSTELYEGKLYVYVDLSYNYDASYTYSDWWSGEIYSSTNTTNGYSNFVYIYENGRWVLSSTNFSIVYY